MILKMRDDSISMKLTWMNVLVTGFALLLACVAFAAYDWVSFRGNVVRSLSTQADILGSNSISALEFNDPKAAENTLSALRASANVLSAGIYRADGRAFALYWRDRSGQGLNLLPTSIARAENHWFENRQIVLIHVIVFQGKPIGAVYIRSDLTEMNVRVKRHALIAALVLVVCVLAASLASSILGAAVAQPIVSLADLARVISLNRQYSLRATPTGSRNEVGILVVAFNEMLTQIQERDAALQRAHDELEDRVARRTAELKIANRELEAFSYSVSHDLRAPVRQISGFASILAIDHKAELSPDAQECVQLIQDGASRMGQLVDDLLNFAKLGRQELSLRATPLNSLVEAALDELKAEYSERTIEWHIGPLPSVECDRGLMKQVFVNLLSNAIKYTSRRQHAVIEVNQAIVNDEVVILFRDNGVGFDQKYAHKLFRVFERLHSADQFEGTGVGLATVHRIMEKHGGRIWVEAGLDQGACFFLSFHNSANFATNDLVL